MLANWTYRPLSVPPFMDTDSLWRDLGVSRLFEGLSREVAPASDIFETAEGLELRVDMPGHDPKNIEVKVEGDTLTIQSERKNERGENVNYLHRERNFGLFTRTFLLPSGIDSTRVDAKYENGVLSVSLPKREDAKPRTIQVKVLDGSSEQKKLES